MHVQAQTLFWSDTFEDTGSPTSGTRTPEANTGAADAYFLRTNGTGINTNNAYTGFQGTKFWAGEDHDALPSAKAELKIDFTGISITGKTFLQFRGLFAANFGAVWEDVSFSSHTDFMTVEYRVDGGAYTSLINFRANNATAKQLCRDNDGNGIGDGPALTYAFAENVKNFSVSGTTLDLRIRVSANGGGEEWAVDNFRLYSSPTPLPVNLVSFSGMATGYGNKLTWITAGEQHNDHFDLERSKDARQFEKIATLPGNNNNRDKAVYSAEDRQPEQETSYYRLRISALDGSDTYSSIISLTNKAEPAVSVYPNPFTDHITIAVHKPLNAPPVIWLTDVQGKRVQVPVTGSGNSYACSTRDLANGIYFLKLQTGRTTYTSVLVK